VYEKTKSATIRSEMITADFFSPIKYVSNTQRIETITRETDNGTMISWIGISLMLSKNSNNTGNNARIK
tara:strand:+ start:5026 stop:5232 length:207 start_codon:yes stop_codon:yes gene_type:complete